MNESQPNLESEYLKDKKVALVHDFLVCQGGAEKVLAELSEMFPQAPIYTLLYDKEAMRGMFSDKDIRTSFLQNFPRFLRKRYRFLLPFFPVAIEAFDLRDFDIVISSSGAWSKGIVTRLNTRHIAYIHSPMRYVWDYNEHYLKEIGGGRLGLFKRMMLSYLRVWDREAADRPDVLIANSSYTQSRIAKYYRRESTVVYPPVTGSGQQSVIGEEQFAITNDHNMITDDAKGDFFGFGSKEYFLIVSRLTPNKKVELAVEAFNKLGLPLIVVGDGKQKQRLGRIAKHNIKVVGWQDDAAVATLYEHARALVFPAEDDFGMVMVEAMRYGVPVIAYADGGALEIVQEGVTGEFFRAQTPEIMADGVRRFLESKAQYDADVIIKTTERFSREKFEKDFLKFLS
ncbi:MAG: glycosyltransferase [Candidatus Moranbacteria bacterium]|nr:glycosyltransferase [Candidatus Moranbacteria bacterium]